MPPRKKFQREDIIEVAYGLINREGKSSVNARRIAKELDCSVQPIFHNFSNMEELNRAVYEKIYAKYKEYMMVDQDDTEAYKKTGLAYIKFAKDYPEFFKLLFMQKTDLDAENFLTADTVGENVIKAGQKLTNLSFESQKKFHVKVWIFTHGIACLVATKTIEFTDSEIDELLTNTVREMLKGQ